MKGDDEFPMNDHPIDPNDFRKACGLWATGVSIVTTVDSKGKPFGLTMNAVSSLSLDPPMFLVCVDNGSDTLAAILDSGVFCVNVLTRAQKALSDRFAKKGDDKFSGIEHAAGATGAPVLADTLLAIECSVKDVLPGGDHQIFCGEVRRVCANDAADAAPLLYYGGRYGGVSSG
jgi:flavin reductase (DIM6/NTAB) family NADH-FMN oxidoreductase RutF